MILTTTEIFFIIITLMLIRNTNKTIQITIITPITITQSELEISIIIIIITLMTQITIAAISMMKKILAIISIINTIQIIKAVIAIIIAVSAIKAFISQKIFIIIAIKGIITVATDQAIILIITGLKRKSLLCIICAGTVMILTQSNL